jgi:phage major head subunit gpT-like protein
MIPERQEYPEKTMTDSKESYSVNKYGASFSVSWETIVNDDLDAISRIPAMHGNAARREQNRAVYAVLTANAALSDTGALFNTTAVTTAGGHANQSASAAVISSTTLNAAYAAMMVQKGLNSSVILNIQPRFLIVPAAISHTALQFVNSIADPGAGGNVAGNSNTLNIYGPQGMRNLQVIIEPQLDASSTSVWYLAADSGQIDTVELTFLQGEESPVLESEWDLSRDVYLYKVRQTFAAKAIDYRGLYRNA